MVMDNSRERLLAELLDRISEKADVRQCKEKDLLYRKAFAYETVDRPPLVASLNNIATVEFPGSWKKFRFYDYRDAFDDPVAMMHNMLLERVVPGLLIGDDSPSAIRNNHGTIQMASLLGGNWELHGNNFPWVRPFKTLDRIREIAGDGFQLDKNAGVLKKSLETLVYYKQILYDYPILARTIQVSMPDLQGPFDTAEQLWGSEIFYALYDEPDLVERLLYRIVEATLSAAEDFRTLTVDRMDPYANAQHDYMIPGRILIRNDTSIMLSPDLYKQMVQPCDALLLNKIGKGSIHFCGNGQHLVESMLEIPDLLGLDFGNPDYMDMPLLYSMCREKKVSITNVSPPREALIGGAACGAMPTGVVFLYYTDNFEDAIEVTCKYKNHRK